ncbi:ATP synthase subunit a [Candidatus Saccharibacteria bacterium RAAC3_TM7_1]|nr:ATP synthase subunit a [Candidatus Saccharibacteria bacterium RAAC3_TM7_1]HCZ28606.1 ATP synthase F0 subunit A [Candidatus Saccharibacteria bacterium]
MIDTFAAIEIHLASQAIFELGGFPITNSVLTGLAGLVIMLALFGYVVTKVKRGQYNRFVGLMQWTFEGMLSQVESVIPDKKLAREVAPLALTIFFFVLVSYWMSILPGLDSIKVGDAPILRSIAADLNFTFAMAIVVLITVQIFAWKTHGPIGNAKRYLRNPLKDPIGSFEGILEFIGEISRYTALSLRLFGNCFAGEILLLIIAVLTSYLSIGLLPVFMAFELFIGFIQAYVFFILTVIFTSLAVESHGDSHDHSPADNNHIKEEVSA